jgi:hypothetical protein
MERATLRARVRWVELGEQSSNYFFSRFRSSRTTASLSSLHDDHNQPFLSSSTRHQYIINYYTAVYANPPCTASNRDHFLSPVSFPCLSQSDIASFFAPFSMEELQTTIRSIPSCRSPGPDGIPYE